MSIDKGMFNFQDVMNKFYNYQPGADDSEGRAIKNSFMANMIQSGFDASMAKDMAYTQASIAKGNMTHAADLEMRNTLTFMNDEFNKGSMNMNQQFELQNRFAEDQNVRDMTKDSIGRGDQYTYNNQMSENQTVRDVTKDTTNQGAAFDYQDKLEDNRNIREMALTGFKGDEQRKNMAASGTQNRLDMVVQGEQQRYGIMQAGDENRRTDSNKAEEGRETMRENNRLEAKTRADQSRYARSGARGF